MKSEKIPKWINDKVFCNWCNKVTNIFSVKAVGNDVMVEYSCGNDHCLREKDSHFTMVYKNYKDMYENFLTSPIRTDTSLDGKGE